jgi:SulP family sulfate permease
MGVSPGFQTWRRWAPPGAKTIANYDRRWLRSDVVAGITVLAYLVPQVLAYSGLIGLPPLAGLVTAMAALIVYALIGSSRIISAGPESTVALMAGLLIAPLAVSESETLSLTITLTMLVAGWLLLGWILRLGAVSSLLSRPILIGYLTGTAILMIGSQLGKATGTTTSGGSVITQLESFLPQLSNVHWITVGVTFATLLLLFLLPLVSSKIPVALTGIALVTAAAYLLNLPSLGVAILGELPRGLPTLAFPALSVELVQTLLFGALGVAFVAYSDVMLTARAFSDEKDRVSPNQELLALSGVHAASALVGGYPSSASSSRTAIAKSAGAVTQVYGLVAAAGILIVLLVAGPAFFYLPTAALAAIIIWAGIRLIVLREYAFMWKFRRSEMILALVTALGTCVLGILPGIGIAVGLSIGEMLLRLARPHDAVEGFVPGLDGMHDIEDYDNAITVPGLLIYRYDAPLFFANADNFRDSLEQAISEELSRNDQLNWIILNVEANMHVDFTAAQTLRNVIARTHEKGRRIGFARLKNDLRDQFNAAGIIPLVGEDMLFSTLPAAIRAYKKQYPEEDVPKLPKAGKPFPEPDV